MKYLFGHENDSVDSETGLPENWAKKLTVRDNHFINGGWGKEEIIGNSTIPAYVIRGTDISGCKHSDSCLFTGIILNLKSRTLQKGGHNNIDNHIKNLGS